VIAYELVLVTPHGRRINAITGVTGTLLMRLPGDIYGEQEKQLKTVRTNANHLLFLINDLLDLAKINSGNLELLSYIFKAYGRAAGLA